MAGKMITAQTVRAALKKLGGGSWYGVAELLIVQTFEDRQKVRQILVDLVKAGQVTYEGKELYRLTDKPGRGSVQAKLWEFACLRFFTAKPFTAVEAARLAEHNLDYTKRYYRWLWNSGYLTIVSRGRAGARLYQVVSGKEFESTPAWNRRAEKRESRCQVSGVRGQEEIPPSPPLSKGGAGDYRLEACATKLDAALDDFGRALVAVVGGVERAWEIIREMKGALLAMEGPQAGTVAPLEGNDGTEGHH